VIVALGTAAWYLNKIPTGAKTRSKTGKKS
jgi:hypothetical protein